VYEIEQDMPLSEYYEWLAIFQHEDEEAKKQAEKAKRARR
jgi:hypothetical protein